MDDEYASIQLAEIYPNEHARRRLELLVGVGLARESIVEAVRATVAPSRLQEWSLRFHGTPLPSLYDLSRQTPLILLSGDTGTGKTELANSVGDDIARALDLRVGLYTFPFALRGMGRVGELTTLIARAFHQLKELAPPREALPTADLPLLVIDEADAFVERRTFSQMHHEDRAGVDAVLRGLDELAGSQKAAVVLMCTNKLQSVDEAVRRRAIASFTLERPTEQQRRLLLENLLAPVRLTPNELDRLARLTGPTKARRYGYTYSDIRDRLLPTAIMRAFPSHPLTYDHVAALVGSLEPTPPVRDDQYGL